MILPQFFPGRRPRSQILPSITMPCFLQNRFIFVSPCRVAWPLSILAIYTRTVCWELMEQYSSRLSVICRRYIYGYPPFIPTPPFTTKWMLTLFHNWPPISPPKNVKICLALPDWSSSYITVPWEILRVIPADIYIKRYPRKGERLPCLQSSTFRQFPSELGTRATSFSNAIRFPFIASASFFSNAIIFSFYIRANVATCLSLLNSGSPLLRSFSQLSSSRWELSGSGGHSRYVLDLQIGFGQLGEALFPILAKSGSSLSHHCDGGSLRLRNTSCIASANKYL